MRKFARVLVESSLLTGGASTVSLAQEEARFAGCIDGPLTVVVSRGPGGGQDLLGRIVGAEWARELGVDLVVQNVPGGGGASGIIAAHQEPADGQTVATWSPPAEHILAIQGHLPFSAGSDEWTMIGATNVDPGVIAVAADSRFSTLDEMLEASRQERLNAAVIGSSTSALEALMYQSVFGLEWGMIPYNSGADLTSAILGGHVDFTVRQGGLYDLYPDEVRMLSVASAERIDELPDVPTVAEVTGEDIRIAAIRGFAVRAGTPDETVQCLREAFAQAAQAPAVADTQYERTGFRYEFIDGEAFSQAAEDQATLADTFRSELLGED